jgi:hypothetical protein
MHSRYVPSDLNSSELIDQAVDHLAQETEETCQAVFKKRKQYSPRGAVWWDDACNQAATAVREAPTPDEWKRTHKALVKEVQEAKC